MRREIKRNLARIWRAIGLLGAMTGTVKRVPVLCYHSINDRANSECNPITLSQFDEQLAYLTEAHNIIPLRELIDALSAGRSLPDNAVVLTFDDGYRDNYDAAFPILRKYGAHATLFVVTGFIDGEVTLIEESEWQPMTWDQIREMDASGLVTVGSHGHTHTILSDLGSEAAVHELVNSKAILERQLGHPIDLFAYPNGQGGDIPPTVLAAARDLGFVGACSTFWRTTHKSRQRFLINRVMTGGDDPLEDFKLKLTGGYDYIFYIHKLKAFISSCLAGKGVWRGY